jgi:hypothetical protein
VEGLEAAADAFGATCSRGALEARAAEAAAAEAGVRREAARKLRALKARRAELKRARQALAMAQGRGEAAGARVKGEPQCGGAWSVHGDALGTAASSKHSRPSCFYCALPSCARLTARMPPPRHPDLRAELEAEAAAAAALASVAAEPPGGADAAAALAAARADAAASGEELEQIQCE